MMDEESYKNPTNDDSSSEMEYYDSLQDIHMETDEDGNGANTTQHQSSHSTINGDLRYTSLSELTLSSEKNTDPDYRQRLINNANNSDFAGDDSFQKDVTQQQDASCVSRTDDRERDNVGQSRHLLTSVKYQEEHFKEGDKKSERAGNATQSDPASFKRYRDAKSKYSSCSEPSSENTDKSDDDQETDNSANRHIESNFRSHELGSENENAQHKTYHHETQHDRQVENSTSPLIFLEQGNTNFQRDNEHDKEKISKHIDEYNNRHPSDTPISNAGYHINNAQLSGNGLLEHEEDTPSAAAQEYFNDYHTEEISSSSKLYDGSLYEPGKTTENKRGEEHNAQKELQSSIRYHASPRTSSSRIESHPEQVEESDRDEKSTDSKSYVIHPNIECHVSEIYEDDTQGRKRQERFQSKEPPTGSENSDAGSQQEKSDEDERITGSKSNFIHPNIEYQMSGLKIESDDENTNDKVEEQEYSNFQYHKESSSSSKYCTKYNEDSQYFDEDDKKERKRQEPYHSQKPLRGTANSDAGSQQVGFSIHEESHSLASDLSIDRDITQHVTECHSEYDEACLSGTSSPFIKGNETDHEEGDYPSFDHSQETDTQDAERNYVDIDNHSDKTTTQENSADESNISDEYLTEDDEDNGDDRCSSPTISRDDDFIYTQQSWETYMKSNEKIPDWEQDVEDELEKLWTRTKFAGRRSKKFYRDVTLYDEDEESNAEESVIRGWKEGENVHVGKPSKEILQIRERLLNDSGNKLDDKNLKQVAVGGARPKTYKKRHEKLVHVRHRVEYEDGGSHQRSRRRHFQETVYSQSSQWYSEDDDDSDQMSIISNPHKGRYDERIGDCEYEDDFDQKNQLDESLRRQMIFEENKKDHQNFPSNSYNSEVRYSKDIYDEVDLPGNGYRNADRKLSDDEANIYSAYPIVDYLAQQPNFGTDAATLLTKFGSGKGVLETIVNKSHIFHCTDNWVKLMPSVHVCPSYQRKIGCSDKVSCLGLHICQKYLIKACKDVDCIMGHNIQTSHNKKVLESFCMEQLESHVVLKIVGPLLGGFASTTKEIHFPKVNEGNSLQPTKYCDKKVTDVSKVLQSNKHEDNLKNRKTVSLYPNLKHLFERSKRDTQVATETFGTVWSHYTGGDTQIPEICSKGLESVCEYETDGCKRLHAKLPYHWQIKTARDNGWMNLQEHQVKHLEDKYCNPALTGTNVPLTDKNVTPSLIHLILENKVWYADFIRMILYHDYSQEPYLLRRLQLQTVGKGNKWKSQIWYFRDNEGTWVPYGETVTDGKSKIRSNVKSSDIEQSYDKREKTMRFSIPDFKSGLHYEIDFAKMIQRNTKTNASREVRRRPKPTEIYET